MHDADMFIYCGFKISTVSVFADQIFVRYEDGVERWIKLHQVKIATPAAAQPIDVSGQFLSHI